MRSAPSVSGRAYQAPRQASPRAYQQRSRQVERPVHRSERTRSAESRRVAPDRQRPQRDLGRNRQVERNAERNRLNTGQKALEGRGREARERGLEQAVAG